MSSEFTTVLQQCALFSELPSAALEDLARLCEPFGLRGGECLLRGGEPSTHLYVVAVGRLRARRNDGSLLGDIARFEPIGEMGMLTGEPHGNEVDAIRDSLLLRIERAALLDFAQRYPAALLAMSRTMLRRLRIDPLKAAAASQRRAQSIAVIGIDDRVDLDTCVDRLTGAFGRVGAAVDRIDARVVDAALGRGVASTPFSTAAENYRLTDWLAAREQRSGSVLYVADAADGAWFERCLRQADRIVVLAQASPAARATAASERLRSLQLRVPIHLVLLRPAGSAAGDVLGWRRETGAEAHHFVAPDDVDDQLALARQLAGRALGLVLGGGGARGFAHIGLVRALETLRLPIDVAGGTSMGALLSALAARGADSREMHRIAYESFVRHNYLNDYLLPRVALIRGRKFLRQLHAVFGDTRIENLRRSFFCVSTNLTRSTAMVHDRGELALWIGTSMAVPGVVPPVVWNGELLADGAIVNSLPTDVMQGLARGPVLASDVSTDGALGLPGVAGPDPEALLQRATLPPPPGLVDILFRSATLTSESGVRARAARADLYLRMPVAGVGLFDWKRLDEIVERGYRHAMETLEQSTALLGPPP